MSSSREGGSRLGVIFRALAETIVPEASALDEEGWFELEAVVEEAVAERPPGLQRQLRLFIYLVQFSALLRHGRPFTSLDAARRLRWLERFQDHPIERLRVGFWGLRTLVLMGYYGRKATAEAIGYRPDPRGWDATST